MSSNLKRSSILNQSVDVGHSGSGNFGNLFRNAGAAVGNAMDNSNYVNLGSLNDSFSV